MHFFLQKFNFLRIVGRMVTMTIYSCDDENKNENENDDGDDEYGNDDDEDDNDNENGLCSNFFHLSLSSHSHLR